MDTKEILKKVRKIEIKTRKLSDNIFGGEYHSAFKGKGMTFSEVRPYQYGDDIRNIDWNVTARYNETFVKVFEEERELTLMLMVDISGSEFFGSIEQFKNEILIELAATLAFSALQNNDKTGLILFSDQIELYIPPKKGKSHILRIIRELIEFQPISKKTNIANAFEFLNKVVKKKAIVFMLSDFIGKDAETGKIQYIDTTSRSIRKDYENYYKEKVAYFESNFRKSGAGVLSCRLDESYIKKLLGYFKHRT